MSVRTVSVELKAKVDDYKAGVTEAATATEVLDQKVEATDRDLKKIPPDAAKAAAALKAMGVESGRTALQLEDVDSKTGKAGTSMGMLETKLADARVEVRKLADEFNRTGNSDSLTKLFKADDAVKELEKLQATLTPALKKQGVQAGSAFDQGFLGALGEIGTAASPVLVPMAILLASEIAAAINGALIGGVALGGIATGIITQFQNPAVAAAGTRFVTWLKSEMDWATSSFVGPLEISIASLQNMLTPVIAGLRGEFEHLAPYIEGLVGGLGKAIQTLMPGFSRALEASGPILMMLAREMPTIANALNIFFDEISKGGKGATEAIDTIIKGISMLIAGLGFAIRYMSDLFDGFVQVLDKGTGMLAKIPGIGSAFEGIHNYVHGIATSYDSAAGAADGLNKSLGQTGSYQPGISNIAAAMKELGKEALIVSSAFDDLMGRTIGAEQANDQYKDSLEKTLQTLKDSKHTLDANTDAGRANREAIRSQVQAAEALRMTNISAGMSVDEANKRYDQQLEVLKKDAEALGYNKAQVQALIDKYRAVPPTVITKVQMTGPGLSDAERLQSVVDGLDGRHVKITVSTVQVGRLNSPYAQREGGIMHYAQGGVSTAAEAGIYPDSLGPIVQFAEPGTGKEGYLPMQGISRSRAASILAEEASWYGYGLSDRTAVGGGWRSASAPGGGGAGSLRVELAVTSAGNSGLATLLMGMVRNKELTLAVNGVPVKVGP